MVLLSFKAVLRRYKRQVLSFRHTFHSLLSYIFAKLLTSLYHQTSHVDPLATWNIAQDCQELYMASKTTFLQPPGEELEGLWSFKYICNSTDNWNSQFKNNVPFPLWAEEGYAHLQYSSQNTRGRKKRKVKIPICFMLEKLPHAV